MQRRHFISSSLAILTAATCPAITPIQRKGSSRLLLGLAAYSFRDNMKWMKGKPNKPKDGAAPTWEIKDFIDYCADNDCPGAELTSYFFPPDVNDAYLLEVKRYAYLRGVTITGTAVGNSWTMGPGEARDKEIADVKRWIDYSAVLGAPHIRVFAGSLPKGMTQEEGEKNCLECYKECLDYAGKKGVFLGLENHGGIVAESDPLIRLVKAADSPWAGINFDSGNFKTADPYADLEKIAPYAVNVQLKTRMHLAGGQKEDADVPRILKILRDANYQGWFTLEYEEKDEAPEVAVPRILKELKPLLQAKA